VRRVMVALLGLALVGACTGRSQPKPGPSRLPFPRGGVLRLTVFGWDEDAFNLTSENDNGYYALDPQADRGSVAWELLRCCLVRTLMSYNGQPTSKGGADPRPDIASGYPTVSTDGLTWTFRLKRVIHYAPPFQRTEVAAQDFIRAVQRGLSPSLRKDPAGPRGSVPINSDFDYLYWVIQGAKDFEFGRASTITGMDAPDPHTLVIHLTQPTGDLAYRMAMPETAPIPPSPTDPSAPFGAETGHGGGDGSFLIGSGPYMIDGSPKLDFRVPAGRQRPVSGYLYGISLTLVRNPSWDPASDPLRLAYPGRIELTLDNSDGPVHDREASDVQADREDIAYFAEGAREDDPLLKAYLKAPSLRGRLFIYPADFMNWMVMNLAMPPFDDIHVRKAVSLVIDKSAVQELNGGHVEADPAGHLAFDSVEDDLLLNFRPYGSTGDRGDQAAAAAEMRRSAYDHDGDGLCDAPVCGKIPVPVPDFDYPKALFQIVRRSLGKIGLHLVENPVTNEYYQQKDGPPDAFARLHYPLVMDEGAFKNFPSGSDFFGRYFGAGSGVDHSLMGATPSELRSWDYSVRSVPNASDRVRRCATEVGSSQPQCWAELDQYLMTEVVPWVPLLVHNRQRIVGDRVSSFTYDQFTTLPSLDRIALRPGTTPAPSHTPSLGPPPAIPDGIYRSTITPGDFRAFRGTTDPDSLRENTGTFMLTLRSGQFRSDVTGDHPFFAPVTIGRYAGSGDVVRFVAELPSFNALTTPPIRWRVDGNSLRFSLLSCEGLTDPEDPTFCNDIRTFFEAHAWEKVG
jgi:ABC-type transport system substrate-binding protein